MSAVVGGRSAVSNVGIVRSRAVLVDLAWMSDAEWYRRRANLLGFLGNS